LLHGSRDIEEVFKQN